MKWNLTQEMNEFDNFKQSNEIRFEGINVSLSGKHTVWKKKNFLMFFMDVFYFVTKRSYTYYNWFQFSKVQWQTL